MAEAVIDRLEFVEIDAEHGKAGKAGFQFLGCFGELIGEQGSVRQIGEHVVAGEIGQLVFRLLCRCHVGSNPAITAELPGIVKDGLAGQ